MPKTNIYILNEEDIETIENKTCDIDFIKKFSSQHVLEERKQQKDEGEIDNEFPLQLKFMGMTIGTAKTITEWNACLNVLLGIMNGNKDRWIKIHELRKAINNANMDVLIPKVIIARYQGGFGFDLLINNKTGEPFIHFDAKEILDLAKFLKNGRHIGWCIDKMFHNRRYMLTHQPKVSEQDFYDFEKYYFSGRLNGPIKHICCKSMEQSGFNIHQRQETLYDEDYHQYIYEGDPLDEQ